jgi:hypothetical protein
MNTYQKDQFSMLGTVSAVCNKYKTDCDSITPLKTAIEEYNGKMGLLRNLLTQNGMLTTGFTSQKSKNKETMAQLASSMAQAARAYAFEQGKMALFDILNYTKTEIAKSSDRVALGISNDIIGELEKLGTVLVPYMVEQADLDLLKQMTKAFETSLDAKVTVKTSKVINTKDVSIYFGELSRFLDIKLDALVVRAKDKLPAFNNEYFKARKIINYRLQGKKEEKPAVT